MLNKELDILLVEDNPSEVALALRAFEKNGVTNVIHHVSDGVEALDFMLDRGKFAGEGYYQRLGLILLDINIPKISGLEVLKVIKENPDTKSIPVIVLSSSDQPSDIYKAYSLGANSYLVKSQGFTDFVKDIGTICYYWLSLNRSILSASR